MNGMDSILTSIKKLLGVGEMDTQFDMDIIMHINTVFDILTQLGVGPEHGFVILDKESKWTDYIPAANTPRIESVKTYMYQKVKLIFDPPLSSSAVEALKESIKEFEWRLHIHASLKLSTILTNNVEEI